MKQLFLALLLLSAVTATAQSASYQWLQTINQLNAVQDLTTASNGSLYLTGTFSGNVTVAHQNLSSTSSCLFIMKCSPEGYGQRLVQLYATSYVLPTRIVADNAGNTYVTGQFQGTLTYNNNQHVSSLNAAAPDAFLLKCTRTGQVQWVQTVSGTENNPFFFTGGTSSGLALDNAGNTYIAGQISGGTIRFGTSSTTFTNREQQTFLASYTDQGQLRWANVWQGATAFASNAGGAVEVDNAGNGYLSGNFLNGWTAGNTTLTRAGFHLYLAKFSTRQGQLQWAVAPDGDGDGRHLALDAQQRVYLTGSFSGTATYGSRTFTSQGSSDGFVARYTRQGQADWASAIGGPNGDNAGAIDVLATGTVYVTGNQNFTDAGTNQAYLAQLQPNGAVQVLDVVGGPGTSNSGQLSVADSDHLYLSGSFTGTCQFDNATRTSASTEAYLTRVSTHRRPVACHPGQLAASVFPNPARGQFTVRITDAVANQAVQALLYTPYGRLVQQLTLNPAGSTAETVFNTSTLQPGLYVLRVQRGAGVTTQTIQVE